MSASERIGVGVIGCAGFMSQTVYLPELSRLPGVTVVAGCDARPELGERAVQRFGIARLHDSADALLADPEVRAVFVLTPPWTHAELAMASLEAGKDTFVEKPLALTSGEGRALASAARARGRLLWVGYMKRHDPACQRAGELRRRLRPELGSCLSAVVEVSLGRWRNGGPPAAVQGPLVTPPPDLGLPAFVAGADRSLYFNLVSAFSHDVNLLHALLGIPGGIGSVRLHAAGRWSACASFVLRYADFDAVLVLRVPDPRTVWQERLSLAFDRGRIELEVSPPLLPGSASALRLELGGHRGCRRYPSATAFGAQLAAFMERLRGGGEEWDLAGEAVRDLELLESVYDLWRSAGETAPVDRTDLRAWIGSLS